MAIVVLQKSIFRLARPAFSRVVRSDDPQVVPLVIVRLGAAGEEVKCVA